MSCAVMRTRSPCRRTLPSSTMRTSSSRAMSGISLAWPLYANEEVRAATRRSGVRASTLRISSLTPSEKYSFSGSPDMLTKGSTAMVRSSAPSPIGAGRPRQYQPTASATSMAAMA